MLYKKNLIHINLTGANVRFFQFHIFAKQNSLPRFLANIKTEQKPCVFVQLILAQCTISKPSESVRKPVIF